MPNARAVWSAVRPSRLAAPAAAPKLPIVAVLCHRRRRVAAHRRVDVVVVEGVARRAVHQGGLGDAGPLVGADQARLGRPALVGRLGPEDLRQRLGGAGDRDAEPIEDALLGDHHRLGRQFGEAVADRLARQALGQAVAGIARVNGKPFGGLHGSVS